MGRRIRSRKIQGQYDQPDHSIQKNTQQLQQSDETILDPFAGRGGLLKELLQRPGSLVISGAFIGSGVVAVYWGGLWVALIVHFSYLAALLALHYGWPGTHKK